MKRPNPSQSDKSARVGARFLLVLGLLGFACALAMFAASPVPANKPPAYPAWWFERDVIPRLSATNAAPIWTDSYSPPSDFMAVNQGQLKQIASRAHEELNARLPGGAGTNLDALYQSLQSSTNGSYNAVNLGQLKNLAKPFYDRLIEVGYSSNYPWTSATADDSSFSVANIGQVKSLFSFDLTAPAGQLPAWWTRYYYHGQSNMNPADDTDGDGRTNLEELNDLTHPLDYFNASKPVLQIVGGNYQDVPATGLPAAALEVQVTDLQSQPLANAPVHFCFFQTLGQIFTAAPSGASVGPTSKTLRTDASGRAKVWVRFSNPAELENLLVSTESSTHAALVEFLFQRALPIPAAGLQLWLKGGVGMTSASGKVTGWASLTGSGSATSTVANAPVLTSREGISAVDFDGAAQRMDLPLSASGNFTLISAVIPDAARTVHPAATNYSSRAAGTSGQRYLFAGARGAGSSPWPVALPAQPANKKFSIWIYTTTRPGMLYPQPTLVPYQPGYTDVAKRYDVTDGLINATTRNPTANWSSGVTFLKDFSRCGPDFLAQPTIAAHFKNWNTQTTDMLYYTNRDWRERYFEVRATSYQLPFLQDTSEPTALLIGSVGAGVSVGTNGAGFYELRADYAPCKGSSGLAPGSGWRVLTAQYSGGRASLYEMGQSPGFSAGASQSGSVTAPRYLGGSPDVGNFFDGAVAEVLAYNRTLTDAERTQVETYLSDRLHLPLDATGNGIPDAWEFRYLGTAGNAPASDADSDGLTLAQEYAAGTDPTRADTDRDGLSDGDEVARGTDPTKRDTDADGIPDGVEALAGSNPLDRTNGDLDTDGNHWAQGPDYLMRLRDTDGDGLTDGQEEIIGADPRNSDTDHDGMPDGWEAANALDPRNPADASEDLDHDGYTNLEEFQLGTNPNCAEDSDSDGIPDGVERSLIYRLPSGEWGYLSPTLADTDGNGTPDGLEDYDQDGLTILQELAMGTDPNKTDTDGDGLNDGQEAAYAGNPLVPEPWATRDSDNDGLTDLFEIRLGTDPFNPDTNGNGMPDGEELKNGGQPEKPGLPPPKMPPPSKNPEPPADPPRTPPPLIPPGEYEILTEVKNVSFPKYGHATFQVLEPPKRYLSMSSRQSFSGGSPESGPLGINGEKAVDINPETGEATTSGDSYVSSGGAAQSPVLRSGSSTIYGYDDPPNQKNDEPGTVDFSSTLTTENTTAMMLANGKKTLGEFEGTLEPGTPFAYRNVHANELQFDYQKVQLKFRWKEGVTDEQKHEVSYLILFQPEDDPKTEEENESLTKAKILETIKWDGKAAESKIFTIDPETKQPGEDGTYSLLAMDIAVDANRDGTMSFSDTGIHDQDKTTKEKPYRFWINNDHDVYHAVDGTDAEYDDVTDNVKDSDYTSIYTQRDLEDFTRLRINFKGLTDLIKNPDYNIYLEWRSVDGADAVPASDGSPAINVYQERQPDVRPLYLEDSHIAWNQLQSNGGISYDTWIGGATAGQSMDLFGIRPTLRATLSEDNPTLNLLFCGKAAGRGQLIVTIKKSAQLVGQYPPVFIELLDIKDMYEHWTVGNDSKNAPAAGATRSTTFQYSENGPEEKQYILYVHGWNMSPADKNQFAETAYKRLYWQGYKGRFGLFEWPTTYGFGALLADDKKWKNGVNGAYSALSDPTNYDRGEWSAWRSALALKDLFSSINSNNPGKLYVMAHSMGNVVAGEALRKAAQEGLGQIVNTYVASQGAVPAHCYEGSLSAPLQTQVPAEVLVRMFDGGYPETANVYGDWLAPNSAAVGRRINFYNVNDYALWQDVWQLNQFLKPDHSDPGDLDWTYRYAENSAETAVEDGFRKSYYDPSNPGQNIRLHLGDAANVSDRYEIMSFAAESRSMALGMVPGVTTLTDNFNLQDIWLADTDNDARPYSRHKWHSAQFRSTNMRQNGYWKALLGPRGFNISPQ